MKDYPIRELESNPTLSGLARISPDIVYSEAGGKPLTMRVLTPWNEEPGALYPLIVFIQGSGWTYPDINFEIPQLSHYARAGFVVATVTHRSTNDSHPFPAYLQDVKCAIRFLRANAERFHIDTGRVCAYGTSSGGNIAMLIGLTGDDARYRTQEYSQYSDAVSAVVECFGPSDMTFLLGQAGANEHMRGFAERLGGGKYGSHENETGLRETSPLLQIRDGEKYPPFLMCNGDADVVVGYETHALPFYRRFRDAGGDAEMIRVKGAPHEGSFWSCELHDIILEFIRAKI